VKHWDSEWVNSVGEREWTGEAGPESAYEEVIVSCSCHDVCIKSAGAATSTRKGMGPLGTA
jgi:hypothetical protein